MLTRLYLYEFWYCNDTKITVGRGQCIVRIVMNVPFGAYPGAYISFSGWFTSRVVPIVLHCIVTRPLFISTIAPIVPMSLLSCTLLFSLVFPRP